MLRGGASDEELREEIEKALVNKPREHQFLQADSTGIQGDGTENYESDEGLYGIPEMRRMVQIGG